jgi:hypothetical protein
VRGAKIFFSKIKNKRKGNAQTLCPSERKTNGNYRVGLLLLCLALLFSVGTRAQSDKVYRINIPAQTVSASLTALSEQTEQMLLFSYEIADTLQANPVVGRYTVMQAVEKMLANTGYTGGLTQQGVLMISIKKSEASDDKTKGKMSMKMKKSILAMAVGSGEGGKRVCSTPQGDIEETILLNDDQTMTFKYSIDNEDAPMPVSGYVGTVVVKGLSDNRSEFSWSATFEPKGMPEADVVGMLEGVLGGIMDAMTQRAQPR